MNKAEQIEKLYEEISRQNTWYMWTVGTLVAIIALIIGIFAYFQWKLNDSQIKQIKNETENELVNRYRLDPDFEKNIVDKYGVDKIRGNEALIQDIIRANRDDRMFNSLAEGNKVNQLISMLPSISDNNEVSKLVLQIINNYISEFSNKKKRFPEYEDNLNRILEQVRLSEQNYPNNSNLMVVKSAVLFFMDPEHFEENVKKEPNMKMEGQPK